MRDTKKITIRKISEEKTEFLVHNERTIFLRKEIYHNYMGVIMFDRQKSLEMIEQVKELYSDITEIENEFDV
jgi:hypothetical protein